MTADMYAWIASVAIRYAALPFLHIGRFGSQYALMPGWVWRPIGWVH